MKKRKPAFKRLKLNLNKRKRKQRSKLSFLQQGSVARLSLRIEVALVHPRESVSISKTKVFKISLSRKKEGTLV